jgi:DNA-binding winged helix-turn-helix (wHTH) protein
MRVPDQSLKILAALVAQPGEVVSGERIQALPWPNGTVVGFERSINAAVSRLREALGDAAIKPKYVESVPRYGYRFIAPVERRRAATLLDRSAH